MITKKPVDKTRNIQNVHYTRSARIAFKYILETLSRTKGKIKLLLPSYIGITDREGSGVFDPVLETGTDYSFYKLNRDLSIDFNNLEENLERSDFNALLVIHYFGFFQSDLYELKELCHINNVTLIEDCAHSYNSFYNSTRPGEIGDFSFFSVHKFLSTDDGGILKVNNEAIIPIEVHENDKMRYETLEVLAKSNINGISEARKNNFIYLVEALESISFVEPMYSELADGVVPMNLPVRIIDQREKVYFELISKGIPTISLYYRLVDEINPSVFPEMHKLSNEILNLPIHQEIEKADLDILIDGLTQITV